MIKPDADRAGFFVVQTRGVAMALRMIRSKLLASVGGIAKIAPKVADRYYFSEGWRELRAAALERDGYRCTVPGCGKRARFVDHIKARRWGGLDVLGNVRSLCETHDAQFKERPDGSRAGPASKGVGV